MWSSNVKLPPPSGENAIVTQDLSSASFGNGVNFLIKIQMESGPEIGQKVKCVITGNVLGSQNNGRVNVINSLPAYDGDTTMTNLVAPHYCTGLVANFNYTKTSDTLTVCYSTGTSCADYK